MRRPLIPLAALWFGVGVATAFPGCDGSSVPGASTTGGSASLGGQNRTGGITATGGQSTLGGTTSTGGIAATGGRPATGGIAATGGMPTTGGIAATGGMPATGGIAATGGTVLRTGGVLSTGGRSVDAGSTLPFPDAGTSPDTRTPDTAIATGGSARTGGTTATGGAMQTGGTTTAGACTFADPPTNVSAWIDASWSSQLGSNVKNRKAWLLDSIMLGKGQINLCVRWGATTAPTTAVKTGMAAAAQKWFTDWFSTLADVGCFPYTAPVVKVTGWAVKPGNTAWVSDLGADVKVYTETDADGEPKCPDACSFFTTSNWNHTFPNCPGGEAFHTDYWMWLDDRLPGGGGAAAVGGDWGLRMPVANFIAAMGKSNLVIEHEIGHGFGFQDYYEWTGATPAGGSLMIVGSSSSQVPTTADQWLLRRTFKEMKTLRGW